MCTPGKVIVDAGGVLKGVEIGKRGVVRSAGVVEECHRRCSSPVWCDPASTHAAVAQERCSTWSTHTPFGQHIHHLVNSTHVLALYTPHINQLLKVRDCDDVLHTRSNNWHMSTMSHPEHCSSHRYMTSARSTYTNELRALPAAASAALAAAVASTPPSHSCASNA